MNDSSCAKRRLELLAPGGSVEAVKAAILAGADAVYCGLPFFNARQRADNITLDLFPELVAIAHQHDCRLYLTLNTLVLDEEIEQCVEIISRVTNAGVDAIIVQDIGILYLLRRYFPGIEIHSSTQMTTHNYGQIGFLAACGVSQVNICRECSLPEIGALAKYGNERGIRTEVFVHGAYCISFSGQCYLSGAMSGRSGNRGECVQPCRRTYSCGMPSKRIEATPFNLKDNSAFHLIKEITSADVSSIKIEGRIKGYKYVYVTVSAWRRQIDRLYSGTALEQDDLSLHAVFNRSMTSGYLENEITKEMFIDTSRDQSLVAVAKIRSYTADTGLLKLEREAHVDPETPVLIYTDGFTFVCTGFLVEKTDRTTYSLKITHKLKGKIQSGDTVYRQADVEISPEIRSKIAGLHGEKKILTIKVSGRNGAPLQVEMTDGNKTVTIESTVALVPAASRSLGKAIIEEKLGMLGETAFTLGVVDIGDLQEGLFLPISELNDIRRRGVGIFSGRSGMLPSNEVKITLSHPVALKTDIQPVLAIVTDTTNDFGISHLPGTKMIYELPVGTKNHRESVGRLFQDHPSIIPWFPAILIDRYYSDAVQLLQTIRPSIIVTDNAGIGWAAHKAGIRWIAGPLLNITNSYSMEAFRHYASCSGAFVSPELSRKQMTGIVAPDGFSRWYILYAPLLLMNTRQCIVRNCTGCQKESTDDSCLLSCCKSAVVSDNRNSTFYVNKRPGFYNQVYNGRNYFNPAVVNDMSGDNAVFLIDIRSIATKTSLRCSKHELVTLFESFIAGEVPESSLRKVINDTTSAQYIRGI